MSAPEQSVTPRAVSVEEIGTRAEEIKADGPSARKPGRDPINSPMIANWVEAIGDDNPIYVDEQAALDAGHPGLVAPPAMTQVWTMRGLHGARAADDPLGRATELLDGAGYTSVVATDCNSMYHRYTEVGEEVTLSAELVDLVGPKNTGLGEGWFFTTRNTWRVGEEIVAEMDFRILKFRPPTNPASEAQTPKGSTPADLDPTRMLRPSVSRDTAFFWEGVAAHELRVQTLHDGSLRHPPIPAIWKPRDAEGIPETTDYRVAAGTGTVFSYVVHHAPKVPGRSLPFVVALVELDEGVRMLGELREVDPAAVRIGMPVEVVFLDFEADPDTDGQPWTLYAWRPAVSEVAR